MRFKYKIKLPMDLWDQWCRSIEHKETINDFIIQKLIAQPDSIPEIYNIFSKIAGTIVIVKSDKRPSTLKHYFQYSHDMDRHPPDYCVYYNDPDYPALNLPIPIICIEDYLQLGKSNE